MGAADGEAPPAERAAPEPMPGDAQAGEQAGREQREEPRVRRLERGQQGLRPAALELGDEAGDATGQEQDRGQRQPGRGRERAVAARDGRPGDATIATRIGPAAARPTRRSTGPPGR